MMMLLVFQVCVGQSAVNGFLFHPLFFGFPLRNSASADGHTCSVDQSHLLDAPWVMETFLPLCRPANKNQHNRSEFFLLALDALGGC